MMVEWCLMLFTTGIVALNNATAGNNSWYVEDHPFYYINARIQLPNGTVVENPNATFPSLTHAEQRGQINASIPSYLQWLFHSNVTQFKTQVNAFSLTVFTSPMESNTIYGRYSVRRRSQQVAGFLLNNAHDILHTLANNLYHMTIGKIESDYAQAMERDHVMSLSYADAIAEYPEYRLSPAQEKRMKEYFENHTNYSLPYHPVAPSLLDYADLLNEKFEPYDRYFARYYDLNETNTLLPSRIPASQYPWQWSERLRTTRSIILKLIDWDLKNLVDADTIVHNKSVSLQHTSSNLDKRHILNSTSASNQVIMTLRFASARIREFDFSTGIPRLDMMKSYYYYGVRFPTQEEYLAWLSGHGPLNQSDSGNYGDIIETQRTDISILSPIIACNVSSCDQNRKFMRSENISSQALVYQAARHFYGYPSIQSHFVQVVDPQIRRHNQSENKLDKAQEWGIPMNVANSDTTVTYLNCSMTQVCAVRSGVTVYTPGLMNTSAVEQFYQNPKSNRRLRWIQDIVSVAFHAEKEALKMGLQAPSTVWNSVYDRDVALFADAVVAYTNHTLLISVPNTTATSLQRWNAVYQSSEAPFVKGSSYYKNALMVNRFVDLHPLNQTEMWVLVRHFVSEMKQLEKEIQHYTKQREIDVIHQQMMQQIHTKAYYRGRPFSFLGFGCLLPATNPWNVVIRDHRTPVPLHLIMRVILRLIESRLLLRTEAEFAVICVVLQQLEIKMVQCGDTCLFC